MDPIQAFVLALIQGITEFLPISSSAHLILPKELSSWPDQGLAFDVAVHVGSLAAVLIYFRKQVSELIVGWFCWVGGERSNSNGVLAWMIVVATIPAALVGLVFGEFIETHLRSMFVIAITTLVFGLMLGVADKRGGGDKGLLDIGFKLALIIGIFQAMALVPGTSRSGVTITAALFLGLVRTDAAKFSFLMSIPIILLSGGHKSLDLIGMDNVDWQAIAIGVSVSAVSAYLCIHFFLSFINRLGMMPFVYYRMVLGLFLLYMSWAAV
jgi:undecaprenyl-diphosphatase